jgi:hypothetical protein
MKESASDAVSKRVQTLVIVVLAAALGVTVSLLMDARRRLDAIEKRAVQAPTPDRLATEPIQTDAELYDVVQDLRARVQQVEAKVGIVRQNVEAARQLEGTLDDIEDQLAALPPVAAGAKDPAEAHAQLQALVKDELQQAERERDERRTERMRARTQEKIEALVKDAKLDAEQTQKLTAMLDAEQTEIRQLFRDARDSGDFASVREQVRTIRAQTDENALAVLDDEQKKAYANMREEERARFLGLGANEPR